jgi:hypothetical protein
MNVTISATSLTCDACAGRSEMWDILEKRMLSANVFYVDRFDFASFGESIVTRVEVLTLFRVFQFGGELSVETEESLLFRGERLRVFL